MKRKVLINLMLYTVLFGSLLMPVSVSAESPITILTAYATSTAADSQPVTSLLNPAAEGLWKPATKDYGTNEGIFIQFTAPVLLDWIEVKVKNGANYCNLEFYLDGKQNVTGKTRQPGAAAPADRIEYWVSYKDLGNDRLFSLGARGGDLSKVQLAYLNARVRAVYIKVAAAKRIPELVSVRFYRQDSKAPLPLKIPKIITGSVTTSSALAPETAYGGQNLFDDKADFAWATDGKRTDGVGELISLRLDKPQDLSGLMLWNGYQRSETHYYANARPAKLVLKIDGQDEFTLPVSDRQDAQLLRFPKVFTGVKTVEIKIAGIYKGTTYRDMVISELKLLEPNDEPIVFTLPPVRINPTNKMLAEVLDISLAPCMLGILAVGKTGDPYSNYEFAFDYPISNIRVRSNGSFVGYFKDGFIAEGSWEPQPDGLRIFGKKYLTYVNDSIYLQSVKRNNEAKIFQDFIKLIDLTKTSYPEVRKYLQTLLAERGFYELAKASSGPKVWWLGVAPFGQVKITGNNEEELLKACYNKAVSLKAYLLVSPLFTDLFMPSDRVEQIYAPY